jgi:cellulose synthase/poly-beta-1,6-N-acetylglucosamine synthase-like glycosyltransferase
MAGNPFTQLVFDLFIICAMLITAYTCNFYYLVFLANKRNHVLPTVDLGTPSVTIQLPIYNEKYVAKRLVDAVCNLDYPKDQMNIMVLDDSDDDTVDLLEKTVQYYKTQGFQIEHIRRGTRKGYKAGALKHAMQITDSEFVAIFDADFIPPTWFLKRAIPHFSKPSIGLIQCRWGHVNENYSTITQVQALSIDFHMLIEQKAKSDSHLFMNFNGTAGIWKRDCIEDAGGWHTATLVEDLDLSYRAQLKGWKCVFLPDIVVDAELPAQMNAAKRQQFRWAKGSIQCATKLLLDITVQRKMSIEAKIQAFIQLTRHIVYPLILIQFLAMPILLAGQVNLYVVSFLPAISFVTYLAMGPGAYILIIRNMYGKSWKSKAKLLPALLVYNAGMSVNNTVAVFDALFGRKNEFLRTPKYGIVNKDDDWKGKAYNLPFTQTTLLEIFFGVYGTLAIFISIFSNNPVFVPIIAIQTI